MSNDWIGKTRKEICKEFNLNEGEVDDGLDGEELASCDKCEVVYSSYDLNWITGEDFELKEGEHLREEIYKEYDCLCEECFNDELKDELQQIVSEKLNKIKNENRKKNT